MLEEAQAEEEEEAAPPEIAYSEVTMERRCHADANMGWTSEVRKNRCCVPDARDSGLRKRNGDRHSNPTCVWMMMMMMMHSYCDDRR